MGLLKTEEGGGGHKRKGGDQSPAKAKNPPKHPGPPTAPLQLDFRLQCPQLLPLHKMCCFCELYSDDVGTLLSHESQW